MQEIKKSEVWWQHFIGEKMKLSGVLSFFIMGLGQIKNKQFGKGLFLLVFQFLYVITEILTSSLFSEVIPGQPKQWGYGYFRSGIWGIVTLGETTGGRFRDNSPELMISGLIVIILLAIYIFFWLFNIKDANNTALEYERTGKIQTSKEFFHEMWEKNFAYMIIGPALVLLLFISIMPILFGVLIAFTNYDAYHLPPNSLLDWVGFKNFLKVFQIPGWKNTFLGVATWTIIWAVSSTFTTFFGGLFLAVIVNNKRVYFKKIWRTILILPWAIPGMISLLVFNNFFNQTYGPLNEMLGMSIPWLNQPTFAKITLIVVNFWLGVPYFMMLMTGLLTSFDKSLYEAARVDGASNSQLFWKITFPILLVQVMPLLIMSFAGNFNNFGTVFFLTEGNPRNLNYEYAGHTDILISWIYKMTKDFKMYNMASVMSFIIFLLIGGISTWNFTRTQAFKEDN